jgi:hypothetical protein
MSVLSDLVRRIKRQRSAHGDAGGGEDLANSGDLRGDISPHEIPRDNPAHAEAQRRADAERERLRERGEGVDGDGRR